MEELKLRINFENFESETDQFVKELELLHSQDLHKDFGLMALRDDYNQIFNKIEEFLLRAFGGNKNKFYQKFENRTKNRFKIPGVELDKQSKIKQKKEEIQVTIAVLTEISRIIRVCELLKNDTQLNFESRKKWTTTQKQEFLLEKLHEVNDGHYFPIDDFFYGNGLESKNPNEAYQLIGNLEKRGLVETIKGGAMITIDGQMYVEEILEKRQSYQTNHQAALQDLSGKLHPKFQEVKNGLKQRIAQSIDNELFDNIMLLLRDGTAQNTFFAIRGRQSSLESSRIKGIISTGDEFLETNRIRDSLLSFVDNLNPTDLKIEEMN